MGRFPSWLLMTESLASQRHLSGHLATVLFKKGERTKVEIFENQEHDPAENLEECTQIEEAVAWANMNLILLRVHEDGHHHKDRMYQGWWRCGKIRILVHCQWEFIFYLFIYIFVLCYYFVLFLLWSLKWKTVWQFLQKLTTELPYYPAILLIRTDPQRPESWDPRRCHTDTNLHNSGFTVAKSWKQTKCPSTCKEITQMWYINTTKYCSVLKIEDMLTRAATRCEAWGCSAERTKPVMKGQILYDSFCMRYAEQAHSTEAERRRGHLRDWGHVGMGVIVEWVQSFCLEKWESSGHGWSC